jgi:excisionase family DNA binding protein
MAATPADGNVVISGRLLALLVTQQQLRRLRIAHRADTRLYSELLVLSAVLLGDADVTKVALAAADGNAWIMTSEAAQRLGVGVPAVRRALREGRLRGTKRGRLWLVDAADLTIRELAC